MPDPFIVLKEEKMPKETKFPRIIPCIDRNRYVLTFTLIFVHKLLEMPLIIPIGFVTDGASIPRFLWRVFGHPFQAKFLRAAVIHDYLLAKALYTKEIADEIFYIILLQDGVGKRKAKLMYWAVRKFGKGNYKEQ